MAGARILLELQLDQVQAGLDRLATLEADGAGLMLHDIGEYLLRSHQQRFSQEVSPEGAAWAPLSPRYRQRKARLRPGARTLVYDNFLKGTLRYQLDGGALLFGTDRPYGALQHWGGRTGMAPGPAAVVARPWLGLSAADDDEIGLIVLDHLERAADGG